MASEMEIIRPGDEQISLSPIANLDAVTKSEINMQVEFAMAHPRSITAVLKEVEELVTLNQSIAEESFYTLKRKDQAGNVKLIQGPSIRFAEVLCYCWGHVRWQKQIVDMDDEFVTGEGVFMDLQRNIVGKVKTKRRITGKDGKRYNADMIQVTGNAAASLSYRNAVTGSIPVALWKDILEKAKVVAVGGTASIGEKRTLALAYGAKIGVSAEQIFETLGVQGINDIGVDELIALKGLFNSLKDGDTTIEDAFGDPYAKELDELFDKLQYNKGRRDVLVGNYKGRSVDLLAYLRKQAEPFGDPKLKNIADAKNEDGTSKYVGEDGQPLTHKDETGKRVAAPENTPPQDTTQAAPKKRGRPAGKKETAEPVKEAVVAAENPHFKDGTFAPKAEEKPMETKAEPEVGSFNF